MFIDEKTQVQIHADLDSTVIRATNRTQDLIPAFMDVIKDTMEYVQMMNVVPSHAYEDDEAEWWDSDECLDFMVGSLCDTLNEYAPDGHYFGTHQCGVYDYGYWSINLDVKDE